MNKLLCFILLFPSLALSKVSVITTTTNLKSLVEFVGGEEVDVIALTKGVQDPHYVEAKPSFMIKASRAELLVSIGMGLEGAWLPLIVRGSRNPKLQNKELNHLVLGNFINPIEIPKEGFSRADGDLHPEGNPHFMLDPIRSIVAAKKIQERLSLLKADKKEYFANNAKVYEDKVQKRMQVWKNYFRKTTKVVTYHKTLSYFFDRFKVESVDVLEPKPGVPPSASHILSLIKKVKAHKVKKIIVENYFDPSVAKRVIKESKNYVAVKLYHLPVAVEGEKGVNDIFDLYDTLVSHIGEK